MERNGATGQETKTARLPQTQPPASLRSAPPTWLTGKYPSPPPILVGQASRLPLLKVLVEQASRLPLPQAAVRPATRPTPPCSGKPFARAARPGQPPAALPQQNAPR